MTHIDLECGGRTPGRGEVGCAGGDCSSDEILESVVIVERNCRICHMNLVNSSPGFCASGTAIELGCCCKDDLSTAHKQCAEIWFKIRGNKTCEICNSVALNVVCPEEAENEPEVGEISGLAPVVVTSAIPTGGERRCSCGGNQSLNFVLGCMVFAFVVSWLFHFNVPT